MAPDIAVFSVGFVLSAAVTFWFLDATVGQLAARTLTVSIRFAVVGVALLALLCADIVGRRRGRLCSLGPTRQTPRHWGWSPTGVFLWGLDTGIPVTTVRASGLPVAGVVATALGLGASWLGLIYALGFLGALMAACVVPSPTHSASCDDIDVVGAALAGTESSARVIGHVSLALTAVVLTALSPVVALG